MLYSSSNYHIIKLALGVPLRSARVGSPLLSFGWALMVAEFTEGPKGAPKRFPAITNAEYKYIQIYKVLKTL